MVRLPRSMKRGVWVKRIVDSSRACTIAQSRKHFFFFPFTKSILEEALQSSIRVIVIVGIGRSCFIAIHQPSPHPIDLSSPCEGTPLFSLL